MLNVGACESGMSNVKLDTVFFLLGPPLVLSGVGDSPAKKKSHANAIDRLAKRKCEVVLWYPLQFAPHSTTAMFILIIIASAIGL
jgi:hypothetical protein